MANTREENVAEARREAQEIAKWQRVRRADLEWARQWHNGSPHCPHCRLADFGPVELETDTQVRREKYHCVRCQARWTVEFREAALVVLREDREDDWVELPLLSERETATVLASLRYWRREGPSSCGHERDIETACGRLQPLCAEEIDALCRRIGGLDLDPSEAWKG